MTISAAVLDAMIAAGATAEVIAAAVRVDIAENEARIERKRANNAERQRRFRVAHSNASNALHGVSNALLPSPDKERSPRPPKEINPIPVLVSLAQCAREEDTGFNAFWSVYRNKVGKRAAQKAWPKALERAESLEVILAGVQRYIRDIPDDRPWCNPATWLNGDRWTDEPLYAVENRGRMNGHGPPKRGSAALSELARRPFEEVFPNVRSFNRS